MGVKHGAAPDEFELLALGSHLPGCGYGSETGPQWAGQDSGALLSVTQEHTAGAGPAASPSAPAGPWPPALLGLLQVGSLSLPVIGGTASVHTSPIQARDEVFQNVTFLPASFPAL